MYDKKVNGVNSMNHPKNSLEGIRQLINENHLEEAMNVLGQNPDTAFPFQNARAVCWMRMGQPQKAVALLTPFVYQGSSVAIDSKVSETAILNLATARFLSGNVAGAASLLAEVRTGSPMRQKLQTAFDNWKRTRSFLSRIAFMLGLLPSDTPVPLDFPPGEP
jgi:hypothetical protein